LCHLGYAQRREFVSLIPKHISNDLLRRQVIDICQQRLQLFQIFLGQLPTRERPALGTWSGSS